MSGIPDAAVEAALAEWERRIDASVHNALSDHIRAVLEAAREQMPEHQAAERARAMLEEAASEALSLGMLSLSHRLSVMADRVLEGAES